MRLETVMFREVFEVIELYDRSTTNVEVLDEGMTGEIYELIPGVGPIIIGAEEDEIG